MRDANANRARALPGAALLLLALGLALANPHPARAQTADEALRDRVAQLVDRLASENPETAAQAEAALVRLGARALPLLPEPDPRRPAPALDRVREALARAAREVNTEASRVTIRNDAIRLSEVLRELQRQSGNQITDLRQDPANPNLELDLDAVPFMRAIDIVARKAELNFSFYSSDGTVTLTDGYGMMDRDPDAPPAAPDPRVVYAGPFRAELTQINLARDFRDGRAFGNAQLEIAWEPRIRPILFKVAMSDVDIRDDKDRTVAPAVSTESIETGLRPENPVIELNLNINLPERDAKSFKSLKFKADVTVPAGFNTFRFPDLAKPGQTVSVGAANATLRSFKDEDNIWRVVIQIQNPDPAKGADLESYQQGLLTTQPFLERADGSRFNLNGGYSPLQATRDAIGFEYLFVDVPGKPDDYRFVIETPTEFKTIPLEVEFPDVPLP